MPNHGFSEPAQDALRTAQTLVQEKRHTQLEVEHILLVLLRQGGGSMAMILAHLHADVRGLSRRVEAELDSNAPVQANYSGLAQIHITMRAQRVISAAAEWAAKLRDDRIGAEHLLLAIADERGGPARRLLDEAGMNKTGIQAALEAIRDRGQLADPPATSQNLSAEAHAAVQKAQEYAERDRDQLNADYMLLALLNPRDGLASRIIEQLGSDPQEMYRTLAAALTLRSQWSAATTAASHERLWGVQILTSPGAGPIGVDRLLAEITTEATVELAPRLLREAGIDVAAIQTATREIQDSYTDQ